MIINRTTLSDRHFLLNLITCRAIEVKRGAHPLVIDHWEKMIEEFSKQMRTKNAKRCSN